MISKSQLLLGLIIGIVLIGVVNVFAVETFKISEFGMANKFGLKQNTLTNAIQKMSTNWV